MLGERNQAQKTTYYKKSHLYKSLEKTNMTKRSKVDIERLNQKEHKITF